MLPVKIDRYEIKAELGRGGMAAVYKALDPRFKREVAIKVLPAAFMHESMFRARFEREAQTIAALEFPGIVPVYDYGDENGQPYLVMRYMPGGSLADLLKNGPLPIEEANRIFERMASALDYVHSKGIIHRDLKPANILFDLHNNAHLSDFGIARLAEASIALTGDALIGTPSYMSPEQARGDADIDHRSDIYALGAILFEMLTGKLPYEATTPMGIAMKHLIEPVPRILSVKADLPPACEDLIARAMAKEREKRYQNASEMAQALETIVAQMGKSPTGHIPFAPGSQPAAAGTFSPRPPLRRPPRRRPALSNLAAPARTPLPVAPAPSRPLTPPPSRPASTPSAFTPPPLASTPKKKASWTPWALIGASILALALCVVVILGGSWMISTYSTNGGPDPAAINAKTTPSALPPDAPTSPPAETSAPPAIGGLLYQDDFSDPESGWAEYEVDGIMNYKPATHLVDIPDTLFWTTPGLWYTDVSSEVQAEKVSGPEDNVFGLVCRYNDDENFYFLVISSDGFYGIGKLSDSVTTLLGEQNMQYSQIIHQGETVNIIRADCIGSTLTLYANGTRLAEAYDSDLSEGEPGLIAGTFGTPGTNIVFDNFLVAQP
jgi:serine/threonine-protein kinase